MRLSAIALDYDGTIARGDVLDPAVRSAVAEARTQGITVLLVTGRILNELRQVAGDLHFADGIVAENGAVLHFPHTGSTSALAPRVSDAFLAELRRRSIPFSAGQCLVDADATEAPRLLDVIRSLQLPLVLAFNGNRVMTLPQGVSKATGLGAALDTLRLSPRNTVAIGDAENDHELLRLAEVGVAVGWGSAALQSAADVVLPGTGPPAVADYVRTLAGTGRLPVSPRARRRLLLGHTEDGHEFSLAVRGRNVLVTGDARSGKSWVAGLLCEGLIMHGYSVGVLDLEGDYTSLERLPGVTVLGGEDPPPTPRDLIRAFRYPGHSVVIDLSRQPHEEKLHHTRALVAALNLLRDRTGLPHRVVLEEAHYYLQGAGALQLLDLERNGYTVVTYCASRLPGELLADMEVIIVTSMSEPVEIDALVRSCAGCGDVAAAQWSILRRPALGQAVALPVTDESGGELRLFTIAPRLTPHVRHRRKYVDVPVPEHRAFYFAASDSRAASRATTLRQFTAALEGASGGGLEPYLDRGDFSRWIADVLGDRALAVEMQALEERHRAGAARADTVPDIVAAIRARYEFVEEERDPARAVRPAGHREEGGG